MIFGRLPWYFGVAFGGFGLIMVTLGWWSIAVQNYRLNTYLPAKAHIIESRVIADGDNDYEPLIRYSYDVGGRQYEGQRVFAAGHYSESGQWAWTVCSQFAAGADVTAYYSATDPASSFISRHAIFAPYVFAAFGFVFLLFGGFSSFQSFQGRRPISPPTRGRDGWFGLRPEFSERRMFRLFAAISVACAAYIAILFGDYLALNKHQFERLGIISAVLTIPFALAFVVLTCRYWMLSHDFSDAQVFADGEQFRLGSLVRLRLDQGISRHLTIDELSLGAACMRSDRIETTQTTRTSYRHAVRYDSATVAWNVQKRLAVNRDYAPGSQLSVACEFTVPQRAEASTPADSSIFPIYQWFIVLQIAAKGQPMLKVRFPIIVERAICDESWGSSLAQKKNEAVTRDAKA